MDKINNLLEKQDKSKLESLLSSILSKHFSPVFGAAKQIEHEIVALKVLKEIGYLSFEADEYDYVEKLKITRTKARNLMYQESLRNENLDINKELRKILQNPTIQKDNKDFYFIEVVNPLTMDKLRKKIRELGYISDGTFSGSLAKISKNALCSLVDDLIDKEQKKEIVNKLKAQGYPDTSVNIFIKSAIKKVSSKVADDVGEEIGEKIADNIGNGIQKIFDGTILKNIKAILKNKKQMGE